MVNRLLVLSLMLVAALSSSTPARASTLTVSIQCVSEVIGGRYPVYTCNATPAGGTGTYTQYTWTIIYRFWPGSLTETTTVPTFQDYCLGNKSAEVVVRDSAGATASSGVIPFTCY